MFKNSKGVDPQKTLNNINADIARLYASLDTSSNPEAVYREIEEYDSLRAGLLGAMEINKECEAFFRKDDHFITNIQRNPPPLTVHQPEKKQAKKNSPGFFEKFFHREEKLQPLEKKAERTADAAAEYRKATEELMYSQKHYFTSNLSAFFKQYLCCCLKPEAEQEPLIVNHANKR